MLDRALAFLWAVGETIADDVVDVPQGTVLRTPSLPGAWSANCVRLEGPQPGISLAEAEELAAVHVPDVAYRHVEVEDEATADRLAAEARAAGWEVDLEVIMALGDAPGLDVDTSRVREGDLQEVLDLLEVWFVEEEEIDGPGMLADLRELARREHSSTPERRFVVDDPPGRPAAMTTVRERDRVGQVEDVFALPDVRGRGHGRALIARATAFARDDDHDLVFIVADDEGWPKQLYAKAGFAPIGRRAVLHRKG